MLAVLRWMTRDIGLKIAALFVALVLWGYAALERSYDTQLTVPVEVTVAGDSTRVVTEVDARKAIVSLEAKGKDLIQLRRRLLRFRPSVPEGRSGTKQVKLSSTDLGLPSSIIVRGIDPELVEVQLTPAARRELQVIVPTRGQSPANLTVLGLRPVSPVRVYGPDADLQLVASVVTESLDLATVTRPGVVRLRVMPPPGAGFSVRPDSVDIEVLLEREAAKILLDVPVKVVAPQGLDVEVDPEVGQVAIAGPASRLDSLKAADMVLTIKIASLPPGEHRLAAEVSSLPRGFRLVKCEPQLFGVTIR